MRPCHPRTHPVRRVARISFTIQLQAEILSGQIRTSAMRIDRIASAPWSLIEHDFSKGRYPLCRIML